MTVPAGGDLAANLIRENLIASVNRTIIQILNRLAQKQTPGDKGGLLLGITEYISHVSLVAYVCGPAEVSAKLEKSLARKNLLGLTITHSPDPSWSAYEELARLADLSPRTLEAALKDLYEPESKPHPAAKSKPALVRWVMQHPPSCLASVSVCNPRRVKPWNCVAVEFQLLSPRGLTNCHVYSDERTIDSAPGGAFDCTPLSVQWLGESEFSIILDASRHGDQGRQYPQNQILGNHPGTQRICKKCGHSIFTVAIMFDYHESVCDIGADDATAPMEDHFCSVELRCKCSSCGRRLKLAFGEL